MQAGGTRALGPLMRADSASADVTVSGAKGPGIPFGLAELESMLRCAQDDNHLSYHRLARHQRGGGFDYHCLLLSEALRPALDEYELNRAVPREAHTTLSSVSEPFSDAVADAVGAGASSRREIAKPRIADLPSPSRRSARREAPVAGFGVTKKIGD